MGRVQSFSNVQRVFGGRWFHQFECAKASQDHCASCGPACILSCKRYHQCSGRLFSSTKQVMSLDGSGITHYIGATQNAKLQVACQEGPTHDTDIL